MRRGNFLRLPANVDYTDPAQATEATSIINQALQSFEDRLNTVQQTGAQAPVAVSGFTVTGKQGAFWFTWNRIVNVDGYVIVQASDSKMVQVTNRYTIPDGEQCSYSLAVGNVAVTAYFQMYAYTGPQYGNPSPIITASSSVYGSAESAPPAPPFAPRAPLIAPVRSGPNLP